jgi:beta-1,4-N-acetylglucosaminyltransferase
MILVTVGLHDQGFERLVRVADELASTLSEEVIIQFGSSKYTPKSAKHFSFTSSEQMENLIREARIVITHAGAGTILMTLRECKPIIVVPRLKKYNEVFDNHQLQLTRALAESGKAVAVIDPSPLLLREGISNAEKLSLPREGAPTLIAALRAQLNQWEVHY